jgi:glycosyltransferase involved in cell wall biosynthesis
VSFKYALVHEWLTPKATGGSELVVQAILNLIEADLYALIDFESTNPESYLFNRSIGTTFLQTFPKAKQGVQKYLPLLPIAIEQLDLRAYDVILSSSHAVAKGVLSSPHQLHICYCHTPMRYAWDLTFDYLQSNKAGRGIAGLLTRYLLHHLRQWDVISANRVDYFIANSYHTARRIWRCYRREATVIYPPIQVERFPFEPKKQDFYLTVCRLVSYKKIKLIVKAFNQLKRPLVIIGTGAEFNQIQQLAGSHIQVLGWQPDEIVKQYMAQAKAFVYAACEDFGMALVEAQACGTPVIAYGQGGAVETVRDLRQHPTSGTGVLFPRQTVADLVESVQIFEQLQKNFTSEIAQTHAMQFNAKQFEQNYSKFVRECVETFFSDKIR